jgi:DNA adenine methylase
MTAYHGGKQRIGKKLAQIIYNESLDIEDEYDFSIKGYCEPFAGMLGVYQHMPDLFEGHKPKLQYKAGDINTSVVKMWNDAKKGWKPPLKVNRKEFDKLKYNNKSSGIKGFVGHAFTFRGVFFDGYFKHSLSRIKSNANRIVTNGKILKKYNINISPGFYTQFSNLKGYIIYCDPPYQNTLQKYYPGIGYKNKLIFDHEKFWDWCRKMAKDNIVFVSEYSVPNDFEKIHKFGNEKLYIIC